MASEPVNIRGSVELTDTLIEKIAREAEAGYDFSQARRIYRSRGRPGLSGAGVSPRIEFRAPEAVYRLARERAQRSGETLSAVMRKLLLEYATGRDPADGRSSST